MKKISVLATLLAVVMFAFTGCEKENEKLNVESKSCVIHNSFDEIDHITSEMANFHTKAMSEFLNQYHGPHELTQQTAKYIMNHVKSQLLGFDFKYIKFDDEVFSSQCEFICNVGNLNYLIGLSTHGYDWENINLEGIDHDCMAKYLAQLDCATMSKKCNEIEGQILPIINSSNSIEEFHQKYDDFVASELKNLKKKSSCDEYFYVRLFAYIYLSSVEYVSQYLSEEKGLWQNIKETAKKAWQVAKPICKADAEGAVVGACAGAVLNGPGIVGGGMAGACGSSAGYCIGTLFD